MTEVHKQPAIANDRGGARRPVLRVHLSGRVRLGRNRFDVPDDVPGCGIHADRSQRHSFFIFVNAENERVAVLYRRADGDYGVIEPAIGGEYTAGKGRGRVTDARMG